MCVCVCVCVSRVSEGHVSVAKRVIGPRARHAGGSKRKRTTTVGTWLQVCLAASGGGPLLRTNGSVFRPFPFDLSSLLSSPLILRGPLPPAATHRIAYTRKKRERERERENERERK